MMWYDMILTLIISFIICSILIYINNITHTLLSIILFIYLYILYYILYSLCTRLLVRLDADTTARLRLYGRPSHTRLLQHHHGRVQFGKCGTIRLHARHGQSGRLRSVQNYRQSIYWLILPFWLLFWFLKEYDYNLFIIFIIKEI